MSKTIAFTVFALAIGVSSAKADTILDLTTAGASGSLTANDFFIQVPDQSTGTGVIEPFVRIQTNENVVQGYNTDGVFQFDEKAGTWTHSLLLSDVPVVNLGGVNYRQFLLDINQTGSNPLISLNELQVFLGNSPSLTGAAVDGSGTLSFGANANLIYNMDTGAGGDNTIELNFALNSGSGSGDMFFYVRDSLFTGTNQYVYLYSKFGEPNANNDGFEEWAVIGQSGGSDSETPVPEPGSLLLLGSGLVLAASRARNRLKKFRA